MKIDFARHGQTQYNKEHRVMGHVDESLSEEGVLQAQETAEVFKNEKYDVIICSTLMRAHQTACIIAKVQNCPIVVDDRLKERNCGKLEGATYHQLDTIYKGKWSWVIGDDACKDLGVETVDEMIARVKECMTDIEYCFAGKRVLIVSHNGVASCLDAIEKGKTKGDNILISTKNAQVRTFEINSQSADEKE